MVKKTKKTIKKEAEVPEGTKKLNNLVKKRKQEKSKPTLKAPEVTVDMLLDAIPDVEINKRKDGFVKFIKGDCYVRGLSYGIQVLENFHGAPKKVIGRIENQKDLNEWVKTINANIKEYTPPRNTLKEHSPEDKIKIPIRVSTRDRMMSLKQDNESYNAIINRALDKLGE
jgi:hypothetical protein